MAFVFGRQLRLFQIFGVRALGKHAHFSSSYSQLSYFSQGITSSAPAADVQQSTVQVDAESDSLPLPQVPTVAIVGRPNVGKSALFNRLVRRREALVYNTPGTGEHVTRDVREGKGRLADLSFQVLDTPGYEPDAPTDTVQGRATALTKTLIQRSDVTLFVVDGRSGAMPADFEIANWLRSFHVHSASLLFVANKCEGWDGVEAGEGNLYDLARLGMGFPIPVSAETGEGLGELYDHMQPHLRDQQGADMGDETARGKAHSYDEDMQEEEEEAEVQLSWAERVALLYAKEAMPMQLAVLGRPNVGKSSLLARSEVALGRRVLDEGKALVVVLNKMDRVQHGGHAGIKKAFREELAHSYPQVGQVHVLAISALEPESASKVLYSCVDMYLRWGLRLSTGRLNRWLLKAALQHAGKGGGTGLGRVRYLTQTKARPPTFAVFTRGEGDLNLTQQREIANAIREDFGFDGVPLRVLPRSKNWLEVSTDKGWTGSRFAKTGSPKPVVKSKSTKPSLGASRKQMGRKFGAPQSSNRQERKQKPGKKSIYQRAMEREAREAAGMT
ncbi:hypothetical protein CYMTET_20518 [Cymbomonas tetramitiformis]|uniref:GTPase Der n=1 Tax=Cymbomonas tetramitiformis TaxID=36881 RepID=A0AAE0G449_9CHLO|nr:hypothetical protein CYMTET_20518 [Cymbomonas tetramitiformis]